MLKYLLLLIFCIYINFGYAGKYVFVKTLNGKVKGKTMLSRGGLTFFSFRGIPYAKPPIGNLRFRAPVEVSNWEGTLEATRDAPICLQKDYVFNNDPKIEGSEDCLFLNVYTPTIKKTKNLPVIVLIHYGTFQAGNSKVTRIGPQYFLDKDVVYVSLNYRLGIFGFYSTLDDASPGNYGLKDQLMALQWIQKNIHKFGGNPNLVTIHGISAGAASVHHHLLNPRSQGLFHRVIASSGTAINFWGQPLNFIQKDFFRPIAQSVGCNGTTTNIIKCMRKICGNKLLFLTDAFRNYNNISVNYNIVKEKRTKLNPDPFLEEDPADLIKKGNFKKVPFIVGMTPDEGIVKAAAWLLREDRFERLRSEFDELVPNLVLPAYATSQDKISEVWKKVKKFYFKNKNISIKDPETIQGYIDLYTDAFFTYGFYEAVLYHSYNGYKDLWMYNFGYKGEDSLSYRQAYASTNHTIDFDFGIAHMDDTIYLIPNAEVLPELPSSDFEISEIMVEIWTYFALHGEPPKLDDGDCSLDWERIKNIEGKTRTKNKYLNFLDITKSLEGGCSVSMKMQEGFLKERMRFWKNLDGHFEIRDVMWE